MATWYEKCPERLEAELRALADAGLPAEVDADVKMRGQLVLSVTCIVEGESHKLRVEFPDAYPYFAFRVFAPSLSLARHQDPYTKQLCFVARIDTDWQTSDTVAYYLTERLAKILEANKATDTYAGEPQEGAPVTGYMEFEQDSVVLIGDLSPRLDHHHGRLRIGIERGSDPHVVLRGAVVEAFSEDGTQVGSLDGRFQRLYPNTFKARWVRLPSRPRSRNPVDILAEAIAAWPALKTPVFNGAPDIVGIVFQDEARYRELHDIWIFLVRRKVRPNGPKAHAGFNLTVSIARADRVAADNMQARVPRLRPLAEKKVALFGAGAIGSMVAWQLARAGVGRLALVDADVVNTGTIPRWLLGLPAAGRNKAFLLGDYLRRSYPLVEVEPIYCRVGHAGFNGTGDRVDNAFNGANIVLDCTAEFAVHHYLSSRSWESKVPFLWATGTPGGWGGIVGRAVPGQTACWECFSRHRTDGVLPAPAQEEEPDIQPVGCFSPTFRGTGFDMDLISIMAARLAVATLCRGSAEGYPDFDWDVGIANLWKHGVPIAPEWHTSPLLRHGDCDKH